MNHKKKEVTQVSNGAAATGIHPPPPIISQMVY